MDDTDIRIIKTMATFGMGIIKVTDISTKLVPPIDDIELNDRLMRLGNITRYVIVHEELMHLRDIFPPYVELTSEGRLFAKGFK